MSDLASLFGLSTDQALLVVFVVLPFVAAAVVVPLVTWRTSRWPRPSMLTSEILARGMPAHAQIMGVRVLGTVVDPRPMVRVSLRVFPSVAGETGQGAETDRTADKVEPGESGKTSMAREGFETFDLEVVQAFPRSVLRALRPGDTVEIRLSDDRSAGAVVWDPWG